MIATGYGKKEKCQSCGKVKRGYDVCLWFERGGGDMIRFFLCEDCETGLMRGFEAAKEECEVEE